MKQTDAIIIGAGIAGASAGYFLSSQRSLVMLERESQPGYHSTGRSAALFHDTYGKGPVVRLTRAARPFYENTPAGFADAPVLSPRGVLAFGLEADRPKLEAARAEVERAGAQVELVGRDAALARVPVLRPEAVDLAVWEPDCQDLDVHAIHQGFLRGFRRNGGELVCDAEVKALRRVGDQWQLETTAGAFAAPVVIVAAGAWCDEVARLAGIKPVGLSPRRRTAFMVQPPHDVKSWPAVIEANETFYFKPDAGQLLISPANEDPMGPHDVQPDEMDIALAVDRVERATTLQIARIGRKWAGLRSFVADRVMAVGFDPVAPGYFWLAGQGGYGIQTAPSLGRLTAALVTGAEVPADMRAKGVDPADFSPARPALVRDFAY